MRFCTGAFLLSITAGWLLTAQPSIRAAEPPGVEKLTYEAEWRLIHAGNVTVESENGHFMMHLESAGIVSTLYKIDDNYSAAYDSQNCAASTAMDSLEGKSHHDSRVTYDRSRNHALFVERDVQKNTVIRETGVDTPNCVFEALGGLAKLRAMKVAVGQTVQVPISDGRRSAAVKITAEAREDVKLGGTVYHCIRYQADLLNGVVYSRKGKFLVWISEDERHLPVQFQLRMSFPVGTVTLQLEKEEHT